VSTLDAGSVRGPVRSKLPRDAPGDRTRELVTPEGVDLRVRLAEMSERTIAFLIDVAIVVAALVVMTLLAFGLAIILGVGQFGRLAIVELLAIVWLLGFFFLRNFYFMAFELTPRCATLGKRALGLRVTTRNGGPLGFDAIFARNALRELELFLPLSFVMVYARDVGGWGVLAGFVWCALFAFFPLFNRDRLRVGDFVAGTWVIRVPKRLLEPDLAHSGQGWDKVFTQAETDVYGVKELGVLEEVVRRKDTATTQAVAARIRVKIGRQRAPDESDEEFLKAYYLALRRRLETRMLFGHRRRDKFDRP
jgi:uncharacterized RDD family membrane protein YckC